MSTEHLLDTIASVSSTICALMGVQPPSSTVYLPIRQVLDYARQRCLIETVTRCLVYNPDAVGNMLFDYNPAMFDPLISHAPLSIQLRSVFPPKTPVCFASMYSGASPEVHGIRKYERPVLEIDTLFDTLLRSGKRVAIVAVEDSSIDRIFRGRDLDYYSEPYDPEVTARTMTLLNADEHDLIVTYHQEYDDILHRTTPYSAEAINTVKNHIDSFVQLARASDKYWDNYNRTIIFAPDHGAHIDPATGRGDHCEDIADDMNVIHYWGFNKKRQYSE